LSYGATIVFLHGGQIGQVGLAGLVEVVGR
jgi:hypothetical protein